ncbi:MAG: glycosyltransferase [Calditrichaeota bacterium]|nr:glycosyltransferase [Calditrichota bacterium]
MKNDNKTLRILFLSQRFLFPQDTGGKIRTGKILEQLNKRYRITVISNVESPKDDPYLPEMRRLCEKFVPVPWKEIPRYTWRWYWDIFKKSFSIYPVPMLNDYSPELEQAVLDELKNGSYDLAICDFMQSTLNFRRVTGIPKILFQHNVEATISLRHMKRSRDPLFKIFWWLQFRKMFYHEKRESARFDAVIAVSDLDKQRFEEWYGLKNVHVIPTGVDTDFYAPNPDVQVKKQIVFVGAMDWLPNHDAMLFFLEEVFPLILREEPDVKFVIVGRNPAPKLKKLVQNYPHVELTGWVEDTRPYVNESAVFVVPIRIGGGTRMKIFEAMSMEKAIVSTRVGAEGLPLEDRRHIYLADAPEDFARDVITLLRDADERTRIGKQARQYVYENFRWEKVADVFASICEMVVNQKNQSRIKSEAMAETG